MNLRLFTFRHFLAVVVAVFLPLHDLSAAGQQGTTIDPDLQRALQLIEQNKMPEAQPLLEKLNETNPDNPIILELLAYSTSTIALINPDPDARKQDLLRARQMALRAQALGRRTRIISLLLEAIPPNGEIQMPSQEERTPAEQAFAEGNDAFAKGDMDRALERFLSAEQLDPQLYEAPLFSGDAYFKLGDIDQAGESYARAIAIDPDRDTAYRYWGDVLMRSNRLEEARDKLVEGVIAEPYSRDTWEFLGAWANRADVRLEHPVIDVPESPIVRKDDGTIEARVPIGRTDDGSDAWIVYGAEKVLWVTRENRFKNAYPSETIYRHSLGEELAALSLMAQSIESRLKEGSLREDKLETSIANLIKLSRAGLIEPYVLLAMPDEEIVRDYVKYREGSRAKLRQYLDEFVTNQK